MKAMLLRELAGPLRLEEVPIRSPVQASPRARARATGVASRS